MSSRVTASPVTHGADELAERAVDVHLAGHRDAARRSGGCSHSRAQSRTPSGTQASTCSAMATYLRAARLCPRSSPAASAHTAPASAGCRAFCCRAPSSVSISSTTAGMRGSPCVRLDRLRAGPARSFPGCPRPGCNSGLMGALQARKSCGPGAEGDDFQVAHADDSARATGTNSAIMSAHSACACPPGIRECKRSRCAASRL